MACWIAVILAVSLVAPRVVAGDGSEAPPPPAASVPVLGLYGM